MIHLNVFFFCRYFIIQHIIEFEDTSIVKCLCESLRFYYVTLATTQYGSHIVEKCIKLNLQELSFLVEDILQDPKKLMIVAQQEYGNFIVQSALKLTKVIN